METIKVQKIKTIANNKSLVWKERKLLKEENSETIIQQLKAKRECFKICSKTVEKTYVFNGNNYVITSVLIGK